MTKRFLSILLCLAMCLSLLPAGALAEEGDPSDGFEVTQDISSLITGIEMSGIDRDADGTYHVNANQAYSIHLTFAETDNLEMDMDDSVYFELPEGVVASDEHNTVDIGVRVGGYYRSIYHSYKIQDNKMIITWNQDSEYFNALLHAHYVNFSISIQASFDGTVDEVRFGTESSTTVSVDNTGSITITKNVTGLKPDFTVSEDQKKEMVFELRNSDNQVVKTFTYADMTNGSITFDEMEPDDYTVTEKSHPDFLNYTFDDADSLTSASGTLTYSGKLNLPLSNDYEYDKGSLELNKTVNCTNWDNTKTVPDSVKNNISFTVTGPNGYKKTVNYKDFSNGKKTLTGLEVGEYTVTETNKVTGYTWTYKVNNAEKDTPASTVQITKGKTASVAFDNTYVQQTGDLTIQKTVSGGPSVPKDAQFTVTFPDNKTTRTFKYSDMKNGVYELKGVPLGTYNVTESHSSAAVANYSLNVTGEGKVTLSAAGEGKTSTINNAYTSLGALKITKTVEGIDLNDTQKSAIKFEVYNAQNVRVKTLTYADLLSGNDTVSGLPVGTYKIKETAPAISGYVMTSVPSNKEVTVEVALNKTSTGSFKNTYTKKAFTLTVNKEFGDDSFYNASNLPDEIKNSTNFTVTNSKGKTVASGTYAELAEKLSNLDLGSAGPFTVTESNPTVAGIGITSEVSANGGNFSSGRSVKITLEDHKPATVTFKNTYIAQGVISGDKQVIGLPSYEETSLRNNLTFSIYRVNNGNPTIYRENITLTELSAGIVVPAGEYFVRETGVIAVEGFDGPTVNTQVGSDPVKDNSVTSHTFSVEKGGTQIVHFTNTYTNGSGSGDVQLTKYVQGLDEIGSAKEVLLTSNLNVNSTTGKRLYNSIRFRIDEKKNNTWYTFGTFSLETFLSSGVVLRPGHYRLTELDGDVSGYDLHIDYVFKSAADGTNQLNSDSVEFDIRSNQTLNIEAHNDYTKLGNLKITKTIAGDLVSVYNDNLTQAEREAIVFEVTGPFDFYDTFTFDGICNSTHRYGEIIFSNIPVGEYTVTETAGNTAKYNLTVSASPANNKAVVTVGGTAQFDFTNTYNHKLGSLTIRKTFSGVDASELSAAQKQAMVFSVKDSTGAEKYSVNYSQFTNGAYTFTNVPTGTYTVSESIGSAIADCYRVSTDKNDTSVTVSDANPTELAITNTFEQIGTLKLIKRFAGSQLTEKKKATLQFKYWMIDENGAKIGEEKTVSYSSFTNGAYSVKVKPGLYTVMEMDDTTGYTRITTVKVDDEAAADGTSANTDISFGQTSTVTFTNTYGEISSIKINKTVAGDLRASALTEEQKAAIRFTVTDSEGNPKGSFSYSDMENGSKTLKNLAPGVYTVTESITDPDESLFGDYSYTTQFKVGTSSTMNSSTATFTAVHGENTVTFTNTYKRIAPLHVEKSSSHTRVGMVEKDGMKFPVWRFTLDISNMNPLTTRGGTTTFTDVFDKDCADWFRLATAAEVAEALGIQDVASVQNTSLASQVDGKAAPTAVFTESADGNIITISGITADTAEKCGFTYYLIVKNKDALQQINTPTAQDTNNVSRSFKNVVIYQPMPHKTDTASDDADFIYDFTAVSKSITNLDADSNLYDYIDGNRMLVNYADYSLTLNPDGVTIGNQPTITAVDRFSDNQMVLLSSVKATPSEGVSFKLDNNAHTIEFTIPNGTPVTITYRINIVNSHDVAVQLVNSIDLLGFVDRVDREAKRSVGGEGQGEIFSFDLFKVDELNNNLKLNGVPFALYDGVSNEYLTTSETDENGHIEFMYWGHAGSFKHDHNYYLVEQDALPGYNHDSSKIWMRFSTNEDPGTDKDGVNILSNGGELIVTNTPVTATLEVTKNFNDWTKQGSFTFKLEPIDNAPMPAAGGEFAVAVQDDPLTSANESTGAFGLIRFPVSDEDFAGDSVVTYSYTIQEIVNPEDMVAGVYYDTTKYPVSVVISDHNYDGIREVAVTYGNNQRSLTVTNKYETVTVSGSKIWKDYDNLYDSRPDSIVINLLKNNEKVASQTVTSDTWSWNFPDLPAYENGQRVTYSISEDPVSGYETKYDGYNVTNTYLPEKISVLVTKRWEDDNNQTGVRPASITVNLLADGAATKKSLVLNDANNWSGTFTGLDKYKTGTKTEIVYTINEVAVGDEYLSEINGNAAGGFIVTNTLKTYGDLTVSKNVAGNAPDRGKVFDFTVVLGEKTISGTYGEMNFKNGVASFSLKDGESKTAVGLPNGVGYKVTETDYTEQGYVTTKNGDEGTIIGNDAVTASFTNTRNAEGSLTLSKTLVGNDTDKTKQFAFTVKLSDTSINDTFSDVIFTNGEAVVMLRGGESKVIEGLPNGTGFTVTEADYRSEGYINRNSKGFVGTIDEHVPAVASFTNSRSTYGDLTVTKTVAGNAGDKNKAFSFIVELDKKTINSTYGDMDFVNGVASFTLKDGESKTAVDLPNGIRYKVIEADYSAEGYVTKKTGSEGYIEGDSRRTAAFTNTKNLNGSLSVSKTLEGDAVDTNKAFAFTITLSDTSVNGVYSGVAFKNGAASIALKGGEIVTIDGLPHGTSYTVTEADYSAEGYVTFKTGDTGTITETGSALAAFTNVRYTGHIDDEEWSEGNLTVSKTVAGDAADRDQAFSFTVVLSDKTISGTYGDMKFVNGVATFTLKDGQSKTAVHLPYGVAYVVTESDYTADGYVTTMIGDTGTIPCGATATAMFTNTKGTTPEDPNTPDTPDTPDNPTNDSASPVKPNTPTDPTTPDTGDSTHLILWVALFFVSEIALLVTFVFSKKGKRSV